MKDSHLTLRIPAALARALNRLAHLRGMPKSELVREAVASYLTPRPDIATRPQTLSAAELAKRWGSIPRIEPHEADALANDIAEGRAGLPRLSMHWE